MATKELPSPELLRKLLRYEPDTGKLFWRERPVEMFAAERYAKMWNTRYAGKEAFTSKGGNGYRHGEIFKKIYQAHRAVWAMVHGQWPADQIDHINGDRSDNRIENLRSVSHAENQRNQKRPSNNVSGVAGVHWVNSRGKWKVGIGSKGRRVHLGYFADFAEACSIRAAAEIQYDFHINHGRCGP